MPIRSGAEGNICARRLYATFAKLMPDQARCLEVFRLGHEKQELDVPYVMALVPIEEGGHGMNAGPSSQASLNGRGESLSLSLTLYLPCSSWRQCGLPASSQKGRGIGQDCSWIGSIVQALLAFGVADESCA